MPIPSMITTPMITPFRNMLSEVEQKGLQGPDVDEMRAQLEQMERMAQEMDDIGAYTGRLAQDQTFQKFSDAYGRALSAAARESAGGSDEEMLAQTVAAYESTLRSYRAGEAGEAVKPLIPHLERIVELGRSGASYPVFLRQMEEEGLTRVLEGTGPETRGGLERDLGFSRAHWDKHRIEQGEQMLRAYDELARCAPLGRPDPLALTLARRRIEWDLAPLAARWEAVVERWQRLLEALVDWLDAFTRFAPHDARWRPPGASEADVKRNIQRTQECGPGDFRFHEALFQRYFMLGWEQIFTHETFVWEYTARRVEWSDERLALVRATYPHCAPGGRPPAELVARAEELHPDRDYRPDKLQSPPWGAPLRGPQI